MTAERSSSSGGRVVAAALGLVLLLGAPGVGQADTGESERKIAAQALFEKARELAKRGDLASACPTYAESYRLDPSMGTRFYQAECLERLGMLASAWVYYLEVADVARAGGLRQREAYARRRVAALRPRLATLAITVSPAAYATGRLEITRDGIALGESQWGMAVPVDPNEHVVRATAPGKRPWEARVRVEREGQAITVEVPELESAPPPPPVAAAVTPAPAPPRPVAHVAPVGPQRPGSSGQGYRIAGIVVGAAGIVGIGAGAVFGMQAISKQNMSNGRFCDAQGYCDQQGLALRRDAIDAATVSTVAFVVGGALLAGGGTLLLVAPSARDAAPGSGAQSAGAALRVGPGSVALTGRF